MATMVARFIATSLVILLATPLSGEVFAQEAEALLPDSLPPAPIATSTEEVTATSTDDVATTTEEVVEVASPSRENWYRSERISGKIDVGDFVVGPGRTEIEVSPGETVIQEISVTNRITDDRDFALEVEDITGSTDGSFSVSLTGDVRGPYSIQDFISFPEDTFNLELGERARIPVAITVPPDAEPGGYYGSVLVSTIQKPDDTGEVAPRSPIIARVGSLFFLTVRGDIEISGQTTELDLIDDKWWYERGPVNIGIVYENTGSVHVNPYGELSVTNMFGEEVGFVELEPWFVLPKSVRVREVTWDREFLLGRYTVNVKINRGYDDIVDEMEVSFWVLPWKIVGGVFLVLFFVIFSIRAFFRTFEFKRKA